MPTLDETRNKALRLIDYLVAIARLRSKIIRDVKDYERVLWMHEIPREPKYCFTQAWGANKEYDQDIWIEIKKYAEPIPDQVPEICEQWVNNATLYKTDDFPELYKSINIQIREQNPDWNPESSEQEQFIVVTKTQQLTDYPEVSTTWEDFLYKKWIPWTELHKRWQAVQKVYTKLFNIHQDIQKLGEEYELILGIGFLTWRTPSGQSVRRHMISAKANLHFEARLGKFTITPSADGAQLAPELDMLTIEEQPLRSEQAAKDGLISSDDNPWDRSSIDAVLSALSNLLGNSGEGEYYANNLTPSQGTAQAKPLVDYAPALILRKRSAQGLESTLKKISEEIETADKIPPEFLSLCEERGERQYTEEHEKNNHIYNETDPIIYFPKPSNEQQRQIIQKLQSTTGVLVQGPPGTGKSHTIANLICHLLATGQRILVTAKTPRALQVLHKQLPPKVRPLCINLLGSSVDEQRSLEASVTGILSEHDRWDDKNANESIKQLNKEIKELKAEKAEINHRVRSIRESETFQQTINGGNYSGTAAKIALRLKKESDEFNWFQDKIKYDLDVPYFSGDLTKLRDGIVSITPEIEAELMLEVPTIGKDLPNAEILGNLMRQYFDAKTKYSEIKSLLNLQIGRTLEKIDLNTIYRIIESLSKLNVAVENVRMRPMPWIKEAVHDMLIEKITPWTELFRVLTSDLEGIKEAQKIDKQILSVPEGLNRKQLLTDAKNLKQHFDKGGKIGWGPFKPKIVRDLKYLIKEVKVDACPCDSSNTLEMLIENLTIRQTIDHAWKLWEGKSDRKTGPLFLQVAELEELHKALKNVIAIFDLLGIAKESISVVQGLIEPEWHNSAAVANLLETCNAVIVNNDFRKISKELHQHVKKIETFANRPNAHAIAKKALTIIKNWNAEVYNKYLLEIAELNNRLAHAKWVKNTMDELSKFAPILVAELSAEPNNQEWEIRLKQFEDAWAWARANSWLRDFLNKEDLPSLERRLKQIDNSIQTKLEELSAICAWKFCFSPSRMGNHQRQHLIGWQRENKGTKGKGKYVHAHRRNAQAHFKECRDAVPAWIMPLHRVYETVAPSPGTFDVIIVDEASQCGPEALPLTYLAKRLLVVGDEHQISPEAVGVERSQIHRLMEEKLSDFEHADSFDVENSLFAHGKLRFNNRIVLREHFRCMPEIIRFSNDLCYHATPLIPLRQFSSQRLEPLKRVHVTNGNREGSESKVINRPEAESLVDAVVQCCNDERYDEKTMGVIILQGDAQAALIENMLLEQLGAEEMEHRRLICGNPYSFQGDERHVIFLSMVAAPNERIGPFTKPADQRRFNVAASRAQDQMWLFHSVTLNDLSKDCLRRRLLEYFLNPTSIITKALGTEAEELRRLAQIVNRQIEKPPALYDSWFEVDVALYIASKGYRVIPQYPVLEKKRIDLVIESIEGQQLAVECDGDHWHGAEHYEKDMERQRMLERCGWNFHRIRECAYYANPRETMEALWQELYRHGIEPISETPVKDIAMGNKDFDNNSLEKYQGIKDVRSSSQGGDDRKQTDQNSESSKTIALENIQEALALKRAQLSQVIIETLKTRPNYSCVKDALTGLVLKQLGVISRGMPREAFSRKVNQTLNLLKGESIVEIYKSKNLRVRLIKFDNYLF